MMTICSVKVNIEWAIEQALEEAYENAEFDNVDEMYAFVNAWNERNKLTMFEETNIAIDIPEKIRTEYIQESKYGNNSTIQ